MAGLWDIFKVWNDDDTLTAEDLNESMEIIQENSIASQLEGTSTLNNVPNNSLMDAQEAPYPNSVRNYAASIADEIKQLRFIIAQLLGLTEWYLPPSVNLATVSSELTTLLNQSTGAAVPSGRIISGYVDANRQPNFLIAVSGQAQVKVLGTSVPLSYYVGGLPYSLTADKTQGSLQLGPSSSNTATVVAALTTSQAPFVALSSPGTAFTSRAGQICAFQIGSEIFVGRLNSNATLIESCYRAYLFDTTGIVIPAVSHSSSVSITILGMNWVFIDTNQSIITTQHNPTFASIAPSSPSTGDYWYDFLTSQWMVYGGAAWAQSNVVLLGYVVTNTSGAVATRSFDAYRNYSSTNTLQIQIIDSTDLSSASLSDEAQIVSSYGGTFRANPGIGFLWSTSSLDTGSSFANSSAYYLYIDDQGKPWVSLIDPVDRTSELFGQYHPSKPWRCVGIFCVDAFGDLLTPPDPNYANFLGGGGVNYTNATTTATAATDVALVCSGGPLLVQLAPAPGYSGNFGASCSSGGTASATFYLYRDGSPIFEFTAVLVQTSGSAGGQIVYPPGAFTFIDPAPGRGYHIYAAYAAAGGSNQTAFVNNCNLAAIELGNNRAFPRN